MIDLKGATVTEGKYVQGELTFDVGTSLTKETFNVIDKMPKAQLLLLAAANDIPTEPFDKRLLTLILKHHLQNVCYMAFKGGIPDAVKEAYPKRLVAYRQQLAILAATSTDDLLSGPTTRRESTARPRLLFVLDEAKYEAVWKDWRNQKYIVIKSFIDLKAITGSAGASITQVFEGAKETRETTIPNKNQTGNIVMALRQAGIVTLLNPQDERQKKEKTPAAETLKEEKKAETPAKKPAPAQHKKK